jgi:hypothetical protein
LGSRDSETDRTSKLRTRHYYIELNLGYLDEPQSSSETDYNDAAEKFGQDVAGAAGSAGAAAGDGPKEEEGDAGPFNMNGYQRNLRHGGKDDRYRSEPGFLE